MQMASANTNTLHKFEETERPEISLSNAIKGDWHRGCENIYSKNWIEQRKTKLKENSTPPLRKKEKKTIKYLMVSLAFISKREKGKETVIKLELFEASSSLVLGNFLPL